MQPKSEGAKGVVENHQGRTPVPVQGGQLVHDIFVGRLPGLQAVAGLTGIAVQLDLAAFGQGKVMIHGVHAWMIAKGGILPV